MTYATIEINNDVHFTIFALNKIVKKFIINIFNLILEYSILLPSIGVKIIANKKECCKKHAHAKILQYIYKVI